MTLFLGLYYMYFVQEPKILYFSLQVKQPLHHYKNKLWQRKMFFICMGQRQNSKSLQGIKPQAFGLS